MKKLLAILLCAALLVGTGAMLTACTKSKDNTQVANPVTEYDDLASAATAAGFELSVPAGITPTAYAVINPASAGNEGAILEISFEGGYLRKAKGNEDISGDYNAYEKTEEYKVNSITYTIKSNEDGASLATWTSAGYTYAFSSTDGANFKTQLINIM